MKGQVSFRGSAAIVSFSNSTIVSLPSFSYAAVLKGFPLIHSRIPIEVLFRSFINRLDACIGTDESSLFQSQDSIPIQ